MAVKFELSAEKRDVQGTGASRRLRRAGKIPAVMYGAGKPAQMLALDHNQIMHNLENEAFFTSLLNINTGDGGEQAILRDLQMHPYQPRILHIDLQRVSATEKLHIAVRIHFVGQDVAPGVKLQGGIVSHLMNEVDISCLPSQLPEYLEVDVSHLNLHESVHLSDIKLPDGVEITSFAHGGDDLAVAAVTAVPTTEEAEAAPAAEAEAAAPAAGEEGAKEKG